MTRKPAMVPLDFGDPITAFFARDTLWYQSREVGLLALRHAMAFQQPGVWGSDKWLPRSVVLLREGDGQYEAFGHGKPNPAVRWLSQLRVPVTLVAPEEWRPALVERFGSVECGEVETWMRPTVYRGGIETPIGTRPLTLADAAAFAASVPKWALRSWMSYEMMIEHGAAFGVPHQNGFAALAWVFDVSSHFDSVGVFTGPTFRRLGLGRAVAQALVRFIVHGRGKTPLWSLNADNVASRNLGMVLGFERKAIECLYRWPRSTAAGRGEAEPAAQSQRTLL